MNPEQMLSQLRPNELPPAIEWWPLAWGWWCLMIALAIVLACIVRACRRSRILQHWKQRRAVIARVSEAMANYRAEPNSTHHTQINIALKQGLAQLLNAPEILSLGATGWSVQLVDALKLDPLYADTLASGHYRPASQALPDDLERQLKRGLRQLRPARSVDQSTMSEKATGND